MSRIIDIQQVFYHVPPRLEKPKALEESVGSVSDEEGVSERLHVEGAVSLNAGLGEWMRKVGWVVQRLGIGASKRPFWGHVTGNKKPQTSVGGM